ncbi:putative B3 domain-containing protein At5g58280 isoform X4 [Papaver somniferum]|uniref:putative B3 domain-containing protein At5g58280 isoform X4 n=1 Tax=Papaver somniferum TaxID=3469 RepID=UPI000E6FDE22|nr:putative B3 domain-containing protein At5g58280 isoform X4 [Papaver somniferum]
MAQGNSYEEARKQRLQDNKRRFQELGVLKIANSLSDVIKDKNNTKRKYQVRSKTAPVNPDLVRRSSRPRSQVTYYGRIKCKTSFIAERSDTLKRAKSFQSGLLSRNPSFVKSMSLSNVSGNFGLVHIFKVSNDIGDMKVDETIKAGESKSSKTVDAEQICHQL